MTVFLRAIAAAAIATAIVLPVTPASAIFIKGVGAPQATGCVNAGGTMDGSNTCNLPDGRSCQAMTFARDGVCMSESGEVLPPPPPLEEGDKEEDVGTNNGSDGNTDPANGNDNGAADTPSQ
jgi:putative hemolysin